VSLRMSRGVTRPTTGSSWPWASYQRLRSSSDQSLTSTAARRRAPGCGADDLPTEPAKGIPTQFARERQYASSAQDAEVCRLVSGRDHASKVRHGCAHQAGFQRARRARAQYGDGAGEMSPVRLYEDLSGINLRLNDSTPTSPADVVVAVTAVEEAAGVSAAASIAASIAASAAAVAVASSVNADLASA